MRILARLFMLVAIAVLPALAIQAYTQLDLRREREREVRQNALRLATFASGELDRIVENGAGLLAALARLPAVRQRDPAACSAYFAELKQLFPQYKVIGASDASGNVFCASQPPPPGFNMADRPYWREAMETGEFTVGIYDVSKIVKKAILPLAQAISDGSEAKAGLVYVALDLEWLAEYFAGKRLFNQNATIAIADREGTILLRLPDNGQYAGTKMARAHNQHVYGDEPQADEIVGMDGVRRIIGYIPAGHSSAPGLYVGIGLARDAAFADIDRATRFGVALLTAGFLLALSAAWIGGRQFISQPIARLAEAAGHWRRGDFRVRVAPRGGGEIELLANAFNKMAAELADKQEENEALLATLERRVNERTEQLAREAEERRKVEDALYQSQKIEAVGQLTGGIAHDFNNLLTAVIGNLEMAEFRLRGSTEHPALRYLAQARQSAERGARLTRDLLAFARRQSLRVEPVDLNAVVQCADELLRRTVGPPIRIDHRLAPQLWSALGDASQLELVILNLAINARDAMPGGGTISIETENVAGADPRRPAGLPAGDYVLLVVSDTGDGMTQEVLARCLEPFFTTKDVGKGSGLGLSVVHGIAAQSGGTVEISSEIGRGTSVKVYLPRAGARAEAKQEPVASAPRQRVPLAARVLLVDDDPDVRDVVAAQLGDLGCKVIQAASGRAALDLLGDPAIGSFDLLISDYAMPGLSGVAVAQAVRDRWPNLPVLLITGYNDVIADAQGGADWDWLLKPFRQAELAEHVRLVIAKRTKPARFA